MKRGTTVSLWKKSSVLLLFILIGGCASTPQEPGDMEGGISGTGHEDVLCEGKQGDYNGRCRELQ